MFILILLMVNFLPSAFEKSVEGHIEEDVATGQPEMATSLFC